MCSSRNERSSVPAGRAAAAFVVVNDAAAREGLVNLGIEIVTVGEYQEGKVRTNPTMHFRVKNAIE